MNRIYILLITTFVISAHGYADTDTDKDKDKTNLPIEITADSLIAQEQKAVSVYSGNVVISQGKLKIQGDNVTIKHPNKVISKAIIIGKPATFVNFIEKDNSWVKGHAEKITYRASKKTILFEKNAVITQDGKNSISGASILYNATKETIKAKGDKEKKERIKVIFSTAGES